MAGLNRRTTHVNSIREIRRYVDGDDFENATLQRLEVVRASLKRHYEQFIRIHEELIDDVPLAEFNVHETLKTEVEGIVTNTEVDILERADQLNNVAEPEEEQEAEQEPAQQPNNDLRALLAQRIENIWGEFDGTAWKWPNFRDVFGSTVHESNLMSNVVKFNHLMKALKGEAAEVLGHWTITNENYPLAWQRLNEVYEGTHQAGTELMQRLSQLPKLSKATRKELQHLSNVVNDVKRQVTALGYDTASWDLVFITTIEQRLDRQTKIAWELEREQNEPTLIQLLRFVEKPARALACVPDEPVKPKENRKRFGDKFEHVHDKKKFIKTENKNDYKSDTRTKCLIPECQLTHSLFKCTGFLAKTIDEREKFVKKNKLCLNCLKPGHFVRFCQRGNCNRCEEPHNSTLCRKNPFMKKTNQVRTVPKTKPEKN